MIIFLLLLSLNGETKSATIASLFWIGDNELVYTNMNLSKGDESCLLSSPCNASGIQFDLIIEAFFVQLENLLMHATSYNV